MTDFDSGGAWFGIDDGSGTAVKCVLPYGVAADLDRDYVAVTGIGRCDAVDPE